MQRRQRIDLIVGARPNFVKLAPVYHALARFGDTLELRVVHTGQHYDANMSDVFFQELRIPAPDVFLGVGSGNHGAQTGTIMLRYEEILLAGRPDMVLVFGDVNSTMACALTAVKQHVRVAHVEAGLRSFDRTMPEEINRIVTDRVSNLLFTPSDDANENLRNEGIASEAVHLVGNVMIDSLLASTEGIRRSAILRELELQTRRFALVTLHRPSNVDDDGDLARILRALRSIEERIPIVFPIHPRTRQRMMNGSGGEVLREPRRMRLVEPLPYYDFLRLVSDAAFVLTDSGGIQEEATYLGVPCLTARHNTERPITVDIGTNILVGNQTERIVEEANRVLDGKGKQGRVPPLWDGQTGMRIADVVERALR
jgi:UDP-N-acetylglucosamine 2-epimerase (non-hydrolysing)